MLSNIISQENLNKRATFKEEELSLRLGNSLYNENRVDQSLLIFQDFIDLYPQSDRRSQVLAKIAIIYQEKQQFVAAKRIYHQLFQELGFSSKGLKYYLEEAKLLEIMGNIDEAQKIYAVMRQALPNSALASKAKRRSDLNQFFREYLTDKNTTTHINQISGKKNY